jgi:hypothetical protein
MKQALEALEATGKAEATIYKVRNKAAELRSGD